MGKSLLSCFFDSRCIDGVWKPKSREKLSLGGSSVSCLLAVNRDLWAACESSVHIISSSCASSSSKLVSKVYMRHCHYCYCHYTDDAWCGWVAEWLACWTQVQKGLSSNRSRDAVG